MPQRRTVYLLMFDAYGRGGVARATLSLANRLAERHDVEVLSLYRRRDTPRFPVDPRVRLTVLRDARAQDGRLRTHLDRHPTRLRPEPAETEMTLLTDILLRRRLAHLRPGVLISTRPSLHLAATRFAPAHVTVVGQDHAPYDVRFGNTKQEAVLRAALPRPGRLHGAHRGRRGGLPGRAAGVGGQGPPAAQHAALGGRRRAGPAGDGRWSSRPAGWPPRRGSGRLVRSFAAVADRHPEWELRIFGSGPERQELRELVDRLGLDGPGQPAGAHRRPALGAGRGVGLRALLALRGLRDGARRGDERGRAAGQLRLPGRAGRDRRPRPQRPAGRGRRPGGLLRRAVPADGRPGPAPPARARAALADASTYDPAGVLAQWEDLFARLDSPRPALATAR